VRGGSLAFLFLFFFFDLALGVMVGWFLCCVGFFDESHADLLVLVGGKGGRGSFMNLLNISHFRNVC
jgi:hypothetical protein